MKVQSVELNYFKQFRSQRLDFTDPETGLARDLIVLIGKNGVGKTSLLQAIAATLGNATGRLQKLSDLDWPGFNYELLGKNWVRGTPDVKLTVQFSSSEIEAVHEFYQQLREMGRELYSPASNHIVTLNWQDEKVQANSAAELFQFKGREYAKQLSRSQGFRVFERVGTTLWYTEQRTSTSFLTFEDPQKKAEFTDDELRTQLSTRWTFHQSVVTGKIPELYHALGQKDLYAELEKSYKAVFPKRSFEGSIPREDIDDFFKSPWFYLYDGNKQYEISEMSGGERAIFPILLDFVNWNIHNSVILIDELELHLHPPMQQALLRALPKLGKNNQFIITTHSDYVEQLVPEPNIIRLEV